MIYLMLWILIPKLLFRSRLILFIVSIFIMIVLIYFVVWFLYFHFIQPLDASHATQYIELSFLTFVQVGLVCAVLLGSVIGMKVFKKWVNDLQLLNELQQINLKTELAQLKSQINPHFLFNTLNNLYVLMKTDTEKASQVLLGLSDLLRYQLYDSAREQILLSKEITFIENLLALEKIRKDDFTFDIHSEGQVNGISLPPFLFIPFVENAIKHGASTLGHSYLTLSFQLTDKHLYFYSENSKPAVKQVSIGGIGLKNIQRRLQILYPGNHTLTIADDTNKYTVNLTIPL